MACSQRIITNKTVIGLPETSIGFVPDVGVSYYLNQLPSKELGLFLTLTGYKLHGYECCHAGFSDTYIPEMTNSIKNQLLDSGFSSILQYFKTPDSSESKILQVLPIIKQCFNVNYDVETICNRLSSMNTQWSLSILNHLMDVCPLSLKLTPECFKRGGSMDYYDVIEMEHNVSVKSSEMKNSNFHIGVSHKLIKKQKTRPVWIPNHIFEVGDGLVQQLFEDYTYKLIEYKL